MLATSYAGYIDAPRPRVKDISTTFPYTTKYISITEIGTEKRQLPEAITDRLGMSSKATARIIERSSSISTYLRKYLRELQKEGKAEGTQLEDFAIALIQRQGNLVQDDKRILAVWEFPTTTTELRVERFANLLIQSGLSEKKVTADIQNWVQEGYIGVPIAQAILYSLITHYHWARNSVTKAGLDMKLYELAVKKMHPEFGFIARDQSLRKVSRESQSVGMFDEKFLLGTFVRQLRTIAAIELFPETDSAIRNYYGVLGDPTDAHDMAVMRSRFFRHAAVDDRLHAISAFRPITPSLEEVSFIDIDEHEPLAVTEDMSAPDVPERILKVMCYDI